MVHKITLNNIKKKILFFNTNNHARTKRIRMMVMSE